MAKANLQLFKDKLNGNHYNGTAGARRAIAKFKDLTDKEVAIAQALVNEHFGVSDGEVATGTKKKAAKAAAKTAGVKGKKKAAKAKVAKESAAPKSVRVAPDPEIEAEVEQVAPDLGKRKKKAAKKSAVKEALAPAEAVKRHKARGNTDVPGTVETRTLEDAVDAAGAEITQVQSLLATLNLSETSLASVNNVVGGDEVIKDALLRIGHLIAKLVEKLETGILSSIPEPADATAQPLPTQPTAYGRTVAEYGGTPKTLVEEPPQPARSPSPPRYTATANQVVATEVEETPEHLAHVAKLVESVPQSYTAPPADTGLPALGLRSPVPVPMFNSPVVPPGV